MSGFESRSREAKLAKYLGYRNALEAYVYNNIFYIKIILIYSLLTFKVMHAVN